MSEATPERAALILIGRLASACASDLQGRLVDDEHRRAFQVLQRIATMAQAALNPAGRITKEGKA